MSIRRLRSGSTRPIAKQRHRQAGEHQYSNTAQPRTHSPRLGLNEDSGLMGVGGSPS